MGDPCLVNLAKATNDELDDIKFALEETKATLEEQNTLKIRLEEAHQEIHKLKNSTDEGMIIEEIRKQLKDAKDTFEEEQVKMEENHENEIQILETSVEEKEKYIANLEGKIIALEEGKRSLEVENAQVREQSLQNENLIINAAEEKIQNIEDKLLDRDIEGLQIEEELLNAEIAKKYAAEQDSRARSDQLIGELETFVDKMEPPNIEIDNDILNQPSHVDPAKTVSTNEIPDSTSVKKWSKLKVLIIIGFAASVLTTFSEEISEITTDINSQIKDFVGVDIQENAKIIWIPIEQGLTDGIEVVKQQGSYHYQTLSDAISNQTIILREYIPPVPDFQEIQSILMSYISAYVPDLPPYITDYFSTAHIYLADFYNGSVVYLSHTRASFGSAWASISVGYDQAADIIADAFLSIHRFVYSK